MNPHLHPQQAGQPAVKVGQIGKTGARPRGANLERYGFRFTQVGRHGQESS